MPFSFQKKSMDVEFIETKHRKISSKIPSENSIDILQSLEKYEPSSMNQELPLIWDRAKGYQIFDNIGNIWIDFSSGIFVTNVGHAHPVVKKAGVTNLTKFLSTHLAPNFRVNCIAPGGAENDQDEEFVKKYSKLTPLGRMMKKDELNELVEFLCSEKSSYVTGAEFVVDGGWTAW